MIARIFMQYEGFMISYPADQRLCSFLEALDFYKIDRQSRVLPLFEAVLDMACNRIRRES
jgi:hypothetical protein